ncbi:MAG: GAF domain-containing protein [Myxococcota bacterium]|nr:GAF domain-containing protein [Myxococcota bacterium]
MSGLDSRIRKLDEACKRLNSTARTEEEAARLATLALELVGGDGVRLFLATGGEQLLLASSEGSMSGPPTLAPERGLLGWSAVHRATVRVENTSLDTRSVAQVDGDGALLAFPLQFEGKLLGILALNRALGEPFSDDDQQILSLLSGHGSALLSCSAEREDARARLIELKARSDRYELIHNVGQTLVERQTLESAMQQVVDMVARHLNYSQTAVLLLDAELEELEVISAYGYGDVVGLRIPVTQGATGYAVRHAEPVNIADVTSDPRYVKGIKAGRSELVVPILRGDEVVGVIDLESPVAGAFDSEDVALLRVVASYASAAIGSSECEENLLAERAARQRVDLESRLHISVGRRIGHFGSREEVCEAALTALAETMSWPEGAIYRLEPASGALVLTAGRPLFGEQATSITLGEGVAGRAMRGNEPTRSSLSPSAASDDDCAEMAAPLREHGEPVSLLHVGRRGEPFSRADLRLLANFSDLLSSALSEAALRESTAAELRKLDDRARRLDLLHRVVRSLTRRLSIDELLDELLRLCAEAFELTHVALLLLDEKTKELKLRAAIGYDPDAPQTLAMGEGITGHVAAMGIPILVTDTSKDPRYVPGVRGSRSEMAAPLRVFGELFGVLDAESTEVEAFDEEDLDLFTSFAAQAAVAIRTAELESRLHS